MLTKEKILQLKCSFYRFTSAKNYSSDREVFNDIIKCKFHAKNIIVIVYWNESSHLFLFDRKNPDHYEHSLISENDVTQLKKNFPKLQTSADLKEPNGVEIIVKTLTKTQLREFASLMAIKSAPIDLPKAGNKMQQENSIELQTMSSLNEPHYIWDFFDSTCEGANKTIYLEKIASIRFADLSTNLRIGEQTPLAYLSQATDSQRSYLLSEIVNFLLANDPSIRHLQERLYEIDRELANHIDAYHAAKEKLDRFLKYNIDARYSQIKPDDPPDLIVHFLEKNNWLQDKTELKTILQELDKTQRQLLISCSSIEVYKKYINFIGDASLPMGYKIYLSLLEARGEKLNVYVLKIKRQEGKKKYLSLIDAYISSNTSLKDTYILWENENKLSRMLPVPTENLNRYLQDKKNKEELFPRELIKLTIENLDWDLFKVLLSETTYKNPNLIKKEKYDILRRSQCYTATLEKIQDEILFDLAKEQLANIKEARENSDSDWKKLDEALNALEQSLDKYVEFNFTTKFIGDERLIDSIDPKLLFDLKNELQQKSTAFWQLYRINCSEKAVQCNRNGQDPFVFMQRSAEEKIAQIEQEKEQSHRRYLTSIVQRQDADEKLKNQIRNREENIKKLLQDRNSILHYHYCNERRKSPSNTDDEKFEKSFIERSMWLDLMPNWRDSNDNTFFHLLLSRTKCKGAFAFLNLDELAVKIDLMEANNEEECENTIKTWKQEESRNSLLVWQKHKKRWLFCFKNSTGTKVELRKEYTKNKIVCITSSLNSEGEEELTSEAVQCIKNLLEDEIYKFIKILKDMDADVDMANKEGITPLMLARDHGERFVRLLDKEAVYYETKQQESSQKNTPGPINKSNAAQVFRFAIETCDFSLLNIFLSKLPNLKKHKRYLLNRLEEVLFADFFLKQLGQFIDDIYLMNSEKILNHFKPEENKSKTKIAKNVLNYICHLIKQNYHDFINKTLSHKVNDYIKEKERYYKFFLHDQYHQDKYAEKVFIQTKNLLGEVSEQMQKVCENQHIKTLVKDLKQKLKSKLQFKEYENITVIFVSDIERCIKIILDKIFADTKNKNCVRIEELSKFVPTHECLENFQLCNHRPSDRDIDQKTAYVFLDSEESWHVAYKKDQEKIKEQDEKDQTKTIVIPAKNISGLSEFLRNNSANIKKDDIHASRLKQEALILILIRDSIQPNLLSAIGKCNREIINALKKHHEQIFQITVTQKRRNIFPGDTRIGWTERTGAIIFAEKQIKGDGNCGISVFDATRKDFIVALSEQIEKQEQRQLLAKEIKNSLFNSDFDRYLAERQEQPPRLEDGARDILNKLIELRNKLSELEKEKNNAPRRYNSLRKKSWNAPENASLNDAKNSLSEIERGLETTRRAIDEKCAERETCKTYVSILEQQGWVGIYAMLLYSKNKNLRMRIWRKDKDSKNIDLIKDAVNDPKDHPEAKSIDIVYDGGHFNLLEIRLTSLDFFAVTLNDKNKFISQQEYQKMLDFIFEKKIFSVFENLVKAGAPINYYHNIKKWIECRKEAKNYTNMPQLLLDLYFPLDATFSDAMNVHTIPIDFPFTMEVEREHVATVMDKLKKYLKDFENYLQKYPNYKHRLLPNRIYYLWRILETYRIALQNHSLANISDIIKTLEDARDNTPGGIIIDADMENPKYFLNLFDHRFKTMLQKFIDELNDIVKKSRFYQMVKVTKDIKKTYSTWAQNEVNLKQERKRTLYKIDRQISNGNVVGILKTKNKLLEQQLVEERTEKTNLKIDFQNQLDEIKRKHEQTKTALTETKTELTEKNDTLEKKLKETKTALTETRTELTETKAELTQTKTDLTGKNDRLENELKTTKEALKETNDRQEQHQQTIDDLKRQFAKFQEQQEQQNRSQQQPPESGTGQKMCI